MKRMIVAVSSALALVLLTVPALAQEFTLQEDDVVSDKPDYSPFVDRHYPQRVYWGDTHLHTANSPDAGLVGNKLGPDMAYRFARGEEVTASGGLRVKLIRPLDFLVVADHSEYMGLPPMLATGDPVLLSDPTGKRWYDMYNGGQEQTVAAMREVVDSVVAGKNLIKNDGVLRTVWERNNATADEFNDPGNFTAFIGYEWTSFPGGNNQVTQIKGDGEAHPKLSPNDEFADFETWDKANLDGSAATEDSMLKHMYARTALQRGLMHEQKLGANPFKFGMLGSTDSHTSLSTQWLHKILTNRS